jgi:hypothetical protein
MGDPTVQGLLHAAILRTAASPLELLGAEEDAGCGIPVHLTKNGGAKYTWSREAARRMYDAMIGAMEPGEKWSSATKCAMRTLGNFVQQAKLNIAKEMEEFGLPPDRKWESVRRFFDMEAPLEQPEAAGADEDAQQGGEEDAQHGAADAAGAPQVAEHVLELLAANDIDIGEPPRRRSGDGEAQQVGEEDAAELVRRMLARNDIDINEIPQPEAAAAVEMDALMRFFQQVDINPDQLVRQMGPGD